MIGKHLIYCVKIPDLDLNIILCRTGTGSMFGESKNTNNSGHFYSADLCFLIWMFGESTNNKTS